jgi:bacteriorhodopsin
MQSASDFLFALYTVGSLALLVLFTAMVMQDIYYCREYPSSLRIAKDLVNSINRLKWVILWPLWPVYFLLFKCVPIIKTARETVRKAYRDAR